MSDKAYTGFICIHINALLLVGVYFGPVPDWWAVANGVGIGAGLVRVADWYRGAEPEEASE